MHQILMCKSSLVVESKSDKPAFTVCLKINKALLKRK